MQYDRYCFMFRTCNMTGIVSCNMTGIVSWTCNMTGIGSCFGLCTKFLCPRHSKNGGGAFIVTPVRACVRLCIRPSVRPSVCYQNLKKKHSTKIGVPSITFERLHRFDSYLACWNIISKHRSSLIWVTIHLFLTELWAFF